MDGLSKVLADTLDPADPEKLELELCEDSFRRRSLRTILNGPFARTKVCSLGSAGTLGLVAEVFTGGLKGLK